MPPTQDFDLPIRSIDQELGEIDHTLHQMLLLAELSASDMEVDRVMLQKVLECLQRKINYNADNISESV